MSDAEHRAVILDGARIDSWGSVMRKIVVNGRTYHFTFSEMFGPLLESASGRVLDNQPGQRHPFWDAFHQWLHHGKRMDGDTCLHDPVADGTYWVDRRGISHFVTSPSLPWGRYQRIAAPAQRGEGE